MYAADILERVFRQEQIPTYSEFVIRILCAYVDEGGTDLESFAREKLRKWYGENEEIVGSKHKADLAD